MYRYKRGILLTGVLYFHRISDFRMGGVSRKNLAMFKGLCGERALQNVVIVTNMWGEVSSRIGDLREAELMSDDMFFKPVLDKGARMARHDKTISSAQRILRHLLNNPLLPLRIQEELVDEGKGLSETGVGEELNRELTALIRKHQQEMQALWADIQQAMREKDVETVGELEIEARALMVQIKRYKNDSDSLSGFGFGDREKECLAQQMDLSVKMSRDRPAAFYQQEVGRLLGDAARMGPRHGVGGQPFPGFSKFEGGMY